MFPRRQVSREVEYREQAKRALESYGRRQNAQQLLVPENLSSTRLSTSLPPCFPHFRVLRVFGWKSPFRNLLAAAAGAHPLADRPSTVLREGRVERFTKPYGKAASASQFTTQQS